MDFCVAVPVMEFGEVRLSETRVTLDHCVVL